MLSFSILSESNDKSSAGSLSRLDSQSPQLSVISSRSKSLNNPVSKMAASVERSSGGGEQNSLTLGSTSVPAVSPVKSLHDVVFEPRAYTKMILHAAKYPHCAINGLLLAQAHKDSRKCLTLTDCIPLFHQVSSGNANSKSHKKKDKLR